MSRENGLLDVVRSIYAAPGSPAGWGQAVTDISRRFRRQISIDSSC